MLCLKKNAEWYLSLHLKQRASTTFPSPMSPSIAKKKFFWLSILFLDVLFCYIQLRYDAGNACIIQRTVRNLLINAAMTYKIGQIDNHIYTDLRLRHIHYFQYC